MADRSFTLEEVARHNKEGDCWIVIDGVVYDVSKFLKLHPGGKYVLFQQVGKDSSDVFHLYHPPSVMTKYGPKLKIGTIQGYEGKQPIVPPGAFGDMIPYADPIWYQRFNSPYYNDSHRKFRGKIRKFVDTEILPNLGEWRNLKVPPKDLLLKLGQEGFLAIMVGQPWPTQYVPSGVTPPEKYDYFHELILYDEIARCGYTPFIAAITNGPAIGLPVILRFGSEELKRRVAPDVLAGRKLIGLAISEPQAGSDVAGMVTSARKDGSHYVVNGNKKWITNGTYADFFSTAVVTGEPGQNGLSFLLVERETPGFTVRKLDVRDSDISGTAYLDFDNCRIPTSNLIGVENEGFKLIMYNFNHERFYLTTCVSRLSRVCIEECIKYALKRKTFGKKLAEHQAIRMKIAAMIRQVEMLHAWLEFVTYQMCTMKHSEANQKIGDVVSLLKAQASKTYDLCARETTHVFGGQALYVSGVGQRIESAVGQVKGYQIPGGAEDILDDFGARAAFKWARTLAKL